MATASDVERKEIGRTYRFIIRKLGGIKIKQSSPKDYISRFSSVLKLSPRTQNDALKVLKDAEQAELTSECLSLINNLSDLQCSAIQTLRVIVE